MSLARRITKTLLISGLLGFGSLTLAGCSGKTVPPPCPEVRILSGAEKLTRFRPGNGRDIIDVLHEEEIDGFGFLCEHDFEDDGSGELTVAVAPTIVSNRGPANTQGITNFEYFIAIADSKKNILKRETFPVTLNYTENIPRLAWQNPVPYERTISLKPGENGRNFLIYIGLKLTREELKYQLQTR